jgi:hypothetical protein
VKTKKTLLEKMMTYDIIGIKEDGTRETVRGGYPSLGLCYATATKLAIELNFGGNPSSISRLEIVNKEGKVETKIEDTYLFVTKSV